MKRRSGVASGKPLSFDLGKMRYLLKEISFLLGYSGPSAFCNTFRQRTGQPLPA